VRSKPKPDVKSEPTRDSRSEPRHGRSERGRRAVLCGLLVSMIGATAVWTRPARADFWGGDLPLLTGILTEAIAEVSNLSTMVTQILEEVRLTRMLASGLDSGAFSSLSTFLHATEITASTLTSGIRSMSYSLDRIDGEFQRLFPSDIRATTFAQQGAYYASWNQEILAASRIASRQQTAIEGLADSSAKVGDLVQRSQNSSGEIAQLQLVVQMLSIMHAQLVTMSQTLATTGRILSDMGAASASSSQLSQTKKETSLSNYTARGDPVRVPTRLP
jgi:hypothetical protein